MTEVRGSLHLDLGSGSNGQYVYYLTYPGGTALNFTLPAFASTSARTYIVTNTEETNEVSIKVQTGDYLNGSQNGTFTLAAQTSAIIVNTTIASVGWFTALVGSTR